MGLPQHVDGLPIDGLLTEASLLAYTQRNHPFEACKICHDLTEKMPWHEFHNREEWIKDSTLLSDP